MANGVFPFMLEGLLTRQEAERLTRPYWKPLVRCWLRAWGRWNRQSEDFRARVGACAVARSNVINALAVSFAKDVFRDGPGSRRGHIIQKDEDLSFFKVYISDDRSRMAVLRFNILTAQFIVRNISVSDQKEDYFRHEPIRGMKNNATRLTVGCTINSTKTDLDRIVLSLQHGENLIYVLDIDGQAAVHSVGASRPKPSQRPDIQLGVAPDEPRAKPKPR